MNKETVETVETGTKKPHLFRSKPLGRWICFQQGVGYSYDVSMRKAYAKWKNCAELINKVGV